MYVDPGRLLDLSSLATFMQVGPAYLINRLNVGSLSCKSTERKKKKREDNEFLLFADLASQ